MKKTAPQTQGEKNNVLVDQTSTCLKNAAGYARDNDYHRTEQALLGARNDLKSMKEISDIDLHSKMKTKVRELDNKIREHRADVTPYVSELEALAIEILCLKCEAEVLA